MHIIEGYNDNVITLNKYLYQGASEKEGPKIIHVVSLEQPNGLMINVNCTTFENKPGYKVITSTMHNAKDKKVPYSLRRITINKERVN